MKKLLVLWLALVALTVWIIPTFAANTKGKHHKGKKKTPVTQQQAAGAGGWYSRRHPSRTYLRMCCRD